MHTKGANTSLAHSQGERNVFRKLAAPGRGPSAESYSHPRGGGRAGTVDPRPPWAQAGRTERGPHGPCWTDAHTLPSFPSGAPGSVPRSRYPQRLQTRPRLRGRGHLPNVCQALPKLRPSRAPRKTDPTLPRWDLRRGSPLPQGGCSLQASPNRVFRKTVPPEHAPSRRRVSMNRPVCAEERPLRPILCVQGLPWNPTPPSGPRPRFPGQRRVPDRHLLCRDERRGTGGPQRSRGASLPQPAPLGSRRNLARHTRA